MAKYGEGDSRWIVEERPDGANVHNWHWSEKDCLPWAKRRLAELLQNLRVPVDGAAAAPRVSVSTTDVDNISGEAYVNIRKGKIIPGYELSISLSWSGEVSLGDGGGEGKPVEQVKGKVLVPYLADENAGEDPEIRVTLTEETPSSKIAREAFLAKGKPMILERIKEFVKEMSQGGPAREEIEAKKVTKPSEKTSAKVVTNNSVEKPSQEIRTQKPAPKTASKDKEGFKTITLTERFNCPPQYLYDILMDENRWRGFTQSRAAISKDVGGQFMIFDGAVTGVNVKLEEGKLIMQKWRFQNWEDGHFSTVSFYLGM
jgi:activator of HSP90 ATPase